MTIRRRSPLGGLLRSARASAILLLLVSTACRREAGRGPRPSELPRTTIVYDAGLAYGILDATRAGGGTPSAGLSAALHELADCVGSNVEELSRALAGEASGAPFRFPAAADEAARARAASRLRVSIDAMARRRGAIEAGAFRYLPAATPAARLIVLPCFGMPEDFLAMPISCSGERGLVVDLDAVAARCGVPDPDPGFGDRFGEELARVVTPELFVAGYEAWERSRGVPIPQGDLDRFRRSLLVLGIADLLSRRDEERFDDRGRRRPWFDVEARAVLSRFEENLARALDSRTPPAERESLRLSFGNRDGTPDSNWGVAAGSAMLDAIDRFAPHGRIRRIVAEGPRELARAYAEVCSGHAAIPRLSTETITVLAR